MSLITWNFDKNFIYVIIYWVLEIIFRIFFYMKPDFFKMTKNNVLKEYIYVILDILADLLSGFLVLYSKCASKSKKVEKEEKRTQSEF